MKEHTQKDWGGKENHFFLLKMKKLFFPSFLEFQKFSYSKHGEDEGFHPLVLLAGAVNLKSNYQTYMLKHSRSYEENFSTQIYFIESYTQNLSISFTDIFQENFPFLDGI